MSSTLTLSRTGEHLRFVNRDAQCEQLLSEWWELERLRAHASTIAADSDRWEALRRSVFAVACTGMPGIGKTRFAREAACHLARKKAVGAEPAFEAVLEAAGSVFPVRAEGADAFAQELIRASFTGRNLRLDCSALPRSSATGIAAALLSEYIKGRMGPEAATARAALDLSTDVLVVAELILKNTAQEYAAAGSVELPALLIHIDEAQCLPPEELGDVLRQLLHALVVLGLRVFVIVSGIRPDCIRKAFDTAHIPVHDIVLPLLSVEHMQEIATALLPEVDFTTPAWQRVLWWLGGVPRYLQYTFEAAAKLAQAGSDKMPSVGALFAESVSRESLVDALQAFDGDALVSAVASRIWHVDDYIRTKALNNALVLAVAQSPVPLDHVLLNSAEPEWVVTVLKAQTGALLYWRKVGTSDRGIIEMSPLVLHWVQHRLPAGEPLYPLRRILPFLPARVTDSEALAVSALMYKLHAQSLLGASSVRLSDLGLPVDADDDHTVPIPSCFAVTRTDGDVAAHDFGEVVKRVRHGESDSESGHRRRGEEPVAFVNGPAAPFADAFIILADVVIFIHEERRALARFKAAPAPGEWTASTRAEQVSAEYEKLGAARSLTHVFLYITDDSAAAPFEGDPRVGKNQWVISGERQAALMGSHLMYLRASTLAARASAVDGCGHSASAAVGGAGSR